MKARRKGTDDQFREIYTIEIKGVDGLYSAEDIEFELIPPDHWQDVRERAAIAILPQCLKTIQDVLFRGGSLTEETITKQAAVMAVEYADALVEKLKGE